LGKIIFRLQKYPLCLRRGYLFVSRRQKTCRLAGNKWMAEMTILETDLTNFYLLTG